VLSDEKGKRFFSNITNLIQIIKRARRACWGKRKRTIVYYKKKNYGQGFEVVGKNKK